MGNCCSVCRDFGYMCAQYCVAGRANRYRVQDTNTIPGTSYSTLQTGYRKTKRSAWKKHMGVGASICSRYRLEGSGVTIRAAEKCEMGRSRCRHSIGIAGNCHRYIHIFR